MVMHFFRVDYLNNGDGTFSKDNSIVSTEKGWSYGASFGDFNRDGYLDLAVAKCLNANENNSLFVNNGGNNNWLSMKLTGTVSNRSAIGAVIKSKATINGKSYWQMRQISGQNGYCGQNLEIHFGFGDASVIDSLVVLWPSGEKEILTSIAVNQHLLLTEFNTQTSIQNTKNKLTLGFLLHPNYPNPFNPSTVIKYEIGTAGFVELVVYNIVGEKIGIIVSDTKSPGIYQAEFTGNNLPSGIYFSTLSVDGMQVQSNKMVFLK